MNIRLNNKNVGRRCRWWSLDPRVLFIIVFLSRYREKDRMMWNRCVTLSAIDFSCLSVVRRRFGTLCNRVPCIYLHGLVNVYQIRIPDKIIMTRPDVSRRRYFYLFLLHVPFRTNTRDRKFFFFLFPNVLFYLGSRIFFYVVCWLHAK